MRGIVAWRQCKARQYTDRCRAAQSPKFQRGSCVRIQEPGLTSSPAPPGFGSCGPFDLQTLRWIASPFPWHTALVCGLRVPTCPSAPLPPALIPPRSCQLCRQILFGWMIMWLKHCFVLFFQRGSRHVVHRLLWTLVAFWPHFVVVIKYALKD